MKRLAIFDLDGTLLDTIKDLGAATNFTLEKNGYPTHPLESYPMFVGNGVNKLIERALPIDARSEERIAELRKDFTVYYNNHNTDYSKPYDGITDLLDNIQHEGILIAVASNKYEEATVKLVKHFFPNINFAAINGQREGFPIKPDPSIVFDILTKTGINKQDTLYIGDSGVDMETARRAGVDSVGVTWGFRSKDDLEKNMAGTIVSTAQEIFEILKK